MNSQAERAEDFRALHRKGRILVLPNAWDVASARVFENAGFPAVATSSAGMMVSLGYPDGEVIDRNEFVKAVSRIAKLLTLPLSVDVVAGFGETPDEVVATVRDVIKAGAVGVNIEDFIHAEKRLFPVADANREGQGRQETRRIDESSDCDQRANGRSAIFRGR